MMLQPEEGMDVLADYEQCRFGRGFLTVASASS